jgi:SAM-dependent methyltransferase
MQSLLEAAEELERAAAHERIAYLQDLGVDGNVLEAGCGNGYSVLALRSRGIRAIGVDSSLYRMSRWLTEHRGRPCFVVATVAALPFRSGAFDHTVASGMLEHVGVSEFSFPYRVTPLPAKAFLRSCAVAELQRVSTNSVVVDFPNGAFPIDFWHGDSPGAFRLHRVPDVLNPSLAELRSYSKGARLTVLPLKGRLRFRQVSRKRWGRLLAPVVRLCLNLLDRLPRRTPLLSLFYPFLVVKIEAPTPKLSGVL